MAVKFVNYYATTLVNTINATDTSFDLTSVSELSPITPLGSDHIYLTMVNASNQREVIKVTAVTGSAITCVRAQDDTGVTPDVTGLSDLVAGDSVYAYANAAALEEIKTNATLTLTVGTESSDVVAVTVASSDATKHQRFTWWLYDDGSSPDISTSVIPDGIPDYQGTEVTDNSGAFTVTIRHSGARNWRIAATMNGEVFVGDAVLTFT